jgi:hypothetical protein
MSDRPFDLLNRLKKNQILSASKIQQLANQGRETTQLVGMETM